MLGELVVFHATATPSVPAESLPRNRKSHKKSRNGCLNCITRKVKCDEAPLQCLRCVRKGLICEYYDTSLDNSKPKTNRPSSTNLSFPSLRAKASPSAHTANAVIIDNGLSIDSQSSPNRDAVFHLQDIQLLQHFVLFTSQTVGDSTLQQIYQTDIVNLALQHSYLMHAVLAFSALHITTLRSTLSSSSNYELHHWQRTLKSFVKQLSEPLFGSHGDAMLATATLVNGISFAMMETNDVQRCWPWASSSKLNLQWLKLQGGIGIVLENTQSAAENSLFRSLFWEDSSTTLSVVSDEEPSNLTSEEFCGLVARLNDICEITEDSTLSNNPYLIPLQLLTPLLQFSCNNADKVMEYLGFIGALPGDYVELLQSKDHRALLLLCLWYSTIYFAPCWWTAARSRIECKAIYMYLDKYVEERIRDVLSFASDAFMFL